MAVQTETKPDQPAAKSTASDLESPFQIDELFFSRTDDRGVIQSFNDVFVRIAEYSEKDLRGAPHKIIRHPDMPKGVFWLIWDTLKAGKPISGYVKNRAKSGKYYWVYAIIAPVQGGYLSVRLKPTSPTLAVVSDLYRTLLQQERDDGLSPEQSAAVLLDAIRAKGFADYTDFQAHALVTEFRAREKQMPRPPLAALTSAINVSDAQHVIADRIASVTQELHQATIYTLNMKLQATKLGRDRAAIDAIANNYDLILQDIMSGMDRLNSIMSDAVDSNFKQSKDSQFLLCASGIMTEVVQAFSTGRGSSSEAERARETELLRDLLGSYVKKSNDAVGIVVDECRQVLNRMDTLRQVLLGLSAVRISLRVETQRLGERARGLDSLIANIDESHRIIHDHFEQIFETASHMQSAIDPN